MDMLCYTMLPSFFLISGMLFYGRRSCYTDRIATFWKKFDRLVIPYALVAALCGLVSIPNIGVAGFAGHLWFVRDLFLFFCIALSCYRLPQWLMVLCGGVGFAVFTMSGRMGWHIDAFLLRMMQYLIFFVGGHYAVRYYDVLHGNGRVRALVFAVWVVALLFHVRTLYAIVFQMLLLSFVPSGGVTGKFALLVNEHSFGIYLLHHLIFFALFSIAPFYYVYCQCALVAMPLMTVVVLVLSMVLCVALKRLGFRYF